MNGFLNFLMIIWIIVLAFFVMMGNWVVAGVTLVIGLLAFALSSGRQKID